MIDLGIRAHDVDSTSADDLARRIRSLGFDGIQLVLKKALKTDISTFDPTIITTTFQHPYVMMLGAYFNPVHPDPQVKAAGIETFKKHIELASECGIRYVGSETGSLMGSPWGYVKENHNEASLS
ncbi:MAG: hypothetical protein K9K93_07785, partial [Acholeplasmataceae bacterium]|nr:hypothetical protein [Acholeplasmataceae bacterium]